VELVWGNVKAVELASLCPDTTEEAGNLPKLACTASALTASCAPTS
jgi:hypothetical protein